MGEVCQKLKSETMKIISKLIILFMISFCVNAQEISGKWNGKIQAGETTIEFVFTISNSQGELNTSMAIPARNLTSLKAKETSYENGKLLIDGSNSGWQYSGIYQEEKQVFEGVFKEGVNELPLNLTRGDIKEVTRKKRPQEPKGPVPYRTEEVKFKNTSAGIELAGTLTLPVNINKAPVVILITGSGPQNRDEEIYGHKPFLVLADHLTRNGIAVLRYDDRGVNESTGNFAEATTADFATDVVAAVDFLKQRNDIDFDKIGLVGHSEGGIIAPMVAADSSNDIAFLISLAGTGVSGYETNLLQILHAAKGQVPDMVAYEEFIRGVLDIASMPGDLKVVRQELREYYLSSEFFNNAISPNADKETILKSLVEQRTSVWQRFFYNYNPADMFEKVKCPVLSLNGSLDTQVFANVNQAGIRNALIKGGNQAYVIKELEGLNHLFQKAKTGEMSEYNNIQTTIEPEVLKLVTSWIKDGMN